MRETGRALRPRTASRKRRERILEAAASLFGGRDLSVVKMEEVAQRAGVAKGTLYNYFSSKEDLYSSIITARMDHLFAALTRSFGEEEEVRIRLRKFVVHTQMFFLKYPDFFRIMRKEDAHPDERPTERLPRLRSRLRTLLQSVLERGMKEGTLRPVCPELATDVILGAIEGGVFRGLEEGTRPSPGVPEPDLVFDLIWRSLRSTGEGQDPLAGVRVLVTREEEAGEGLGREISRLGGRPIRMPLLETAPPIDRGPLMAAARAVGGYDWVLFTSGRAVILFHEAVREVGGNDLPETTRIGTVGRATALRARERFDRVDLVATPSTGAGLAAALGARTDLHGVRILLPRAEEGRPELPRLLRDAGATVDEVVAYRTIEATIDGSRLRAVLQAGQIDAIPFASGSAARAFVRHVGAGPLQGPEPRPVIVSIGPSTSEALRSLGINVDEEARDPRMVELARAVGRALAKRGRGVKARNRTESVRDSGGRLP